MFNTFWQLNYTLCYNSILFEEKREGQEKPKKEKYLKDGVGSNTVLPQRDNTNDSLCDPRFESADQREGV